MLKFPPLVVASSSLLAVWAHLGNHKAIEAHMHELCALCGVAKHELLPCKTILLEHFNTTYPKAAEAAERLRAANPARQLCGVDLRPSAQRTQQTLTEGLAALWSQVTLAFNP